MALGHEGVGTVEAVGPSVKHLRKGDRVGWGYESDSCGDCGECLSGHEIYCPERVIYGNPAYHGSFASHAVKREAFLHRTPERLADEFAAPLQCGGATVFTALLGVKPGQTIGIIGVGGLGHLAIQFAAKMGCRVVVLSGSDRKKDEATRLGAHHFLATKNMDESTADTVDWRLNRLLVTTSFQPEWAKLIPLLAPRATVYPLSASRSNLEVPYSPLINKGIGFQGGLVANRQVHREMLQFAALNGIKPVIEKFPMTEEGIKEAMDRLDKGDIHFRAVLLPQ